MAIFHPDWGGINLRGLSLQGEASAGFLQASTIPMDIRRSYEILELDHSATEADVRQAYKDMVSVWHPDRFWNNPRLKDKAEKKLREVNAAHETLIEYVRNRRATDGSDETASSESMAELAAEVGTGIVLKTYSYISAKLRGLLLRKD